MNDLAKTAFEKKQIVLKSNGLAPRDFIWMGDVCDIVQKLCLLPVATNDTFNISGERTSKMIEIAEDVQKAYLAKYGETIPLITNTEDKTIHATDLFVSASKLKKYISYLNDSHFKNEAIKIFEFLEKK